MSPPKKYDLSASRVIQGDALRVIQALPDNSIDAVVTDPPYVLQAGSSGSGLNGKQVKVWSEIAFMSNGFSADVLDELVRVSKAINAYFFCSRKQIPWYTDYFVKAKKCNWDLLAWHKSNPTPACGSSYLPDTEYIFFARDKGVPLYGSYHTKRKYYVTTKNVADKRLYGHPTVKPLEIVSNFIINSTQPGAVVLDPFVGSGTTVVAAEQLGRIGIGIERDREYCAVARKRLKEANHAA